MTSGYLNNVTVRGMSAANTPYYTTYENNSTPLQLNWEDFGSDGNVYFNRIVTNFSGSVGLPMLRYANCSFQINQYTAYNRHERDDLRIPFPASPFMTAFNLHINASYNVVPGSQGSGGYQELIVHGCWTYTQDGTRHDFSSLFLEGTASSFPISVKSSSYTSRVIANLCTGAFEYYNIPYYRSPYMNTFNIRGIVYQVNTTKYNVNVRGYKNNFWV